MHLRQRQRCTKGDENPLLAARRLEAFDTVGKPLPTGFEQLVSGHYRQAARLVADTGPDAALAFYLSKADPLMVLRDLLGHSSVLTTEKYLRRLDTTRIYRDAYEQAGLADGLLTDAGAEHEADTEFADDVEGLS
jgi:integrase